MHNILATLNFFVRFPLLFYKLSPYREEVFLLPHTHMAKFLIFAVVLFCTEKEDKIIVMQFWYTLMSEIIQNLLIVVMTLPKKIIKSKEEI